MIARVVWGFHHAGVTTYGRCEQQEQDSIRVDPVSSASLVGPMGTPKGLNVLLIKWCEVEFGGLSWLNA